MNHLKVKQPEQQKKMKDAAVSAKTLGPISNLEEHVRPDWWCRIFNSNYLKTDADVVNDQKITREETEKYVQILNLKQDDRILDLCCGQGRHAFELARLGFANIEGLDRSHYLIQKARVKTKREGFGIRFREGDARKLPYNDCAFNAVMVLGNSFGYFETVHDDLRVLREIFRILKPWGKVLIDVSDGDYIGKNFNARSWEWIDKRYFVCRERSLSLDSQRLVSREVITDAHKGVVADQFYAERLYSQESLTGLLKTAGFCDIGFQGQVTTDSQRDQDLGMMERRIILTAGVRKEWMPVTTVKRQTLKNVLVVMGDPSKRDLIKPRGIFDDDDFYTIDQMKNCLADMAEYRFFYADNHSTLINDLLNYKPKIDYVFNLCDDGFVNDARKELHVPSLFEILGIPYTGAGPQCLAYCYDKSLVRGIANEMKIPVPRAFFVKPEDNIFDFSLIFPVIVKPNFGDSSFGITSQSVVNNIEELVNVILETREALGNEQPILVEEFLTGKDISVGIIGNSSEFFTFLPIIEEDYSDLPPDLPRICGYEAKWLPDSPYARIKSALANLPDETEKFIEECCLKLFERLECRDYARFDWRLDAQGNPKLLEVNPNPGWCWDGHLAKMAKYKDMSYGAMLREILRVAEQRLKI